MDRIGDTRRLILFSERETARTMAEPVPIEKATGPFLDQI